VQIAGFLVGIGRGAAFAGAINLAIEKRIDAAVSARREGAGFTIPASDDRSHQLRPSHHHPGAERPLRPHLPMLKRRAFRLTSFAGYQNSMSRSKRILVPDQKSPVECIKRSSIFSKELFPSLFSPTRIVSLESGRCVLEYPRRFSTLSESMRSTNPSLSSGSESANAAALPRNAAR
jgi:hypothetical protein